MRDVRLRVPACEPVCMCHVRCVRGCVRVNGLRVDVCALCVGMRDRDA